VENGRSKEGGYPVERRKIRQWVLKITAYADQLIEDLNLIDWPESLKKLQINWIGRSEGAKTHFIEQKTKQPISVFTTMPETLFGVTFLAVSPEFPLVSQIVTLEQKETVDAYVKHVSTKSDLERTDLNKEKTGVWTGAYAINPVNDQLIPIWVADYVLMGYGTGAVMGVPAHDERDFAFAKKYALAIEPVVDPAVDQHPELIPEGYKSKDIKLEVLRGDRCWVDEGIVFNSAHGTLSLNGLTVPLAREKVIQWLEQHKKGERNVNYKLRDWLFSRQRYWGEPFPILHLADGTKRVLDIDELPLCPPDLSDFKPSGSGESPLAKVKEWVEIVDLKTGQSAHRETNTMPQWAGSCWYYLRFCDPLNAQAAWSREAEEYWMPVDLYVGGVEHAVLHLLYARFWHKVLFDCGLVSTKEPFQTLRNQGLVVARSYQHPKTGVYVPPEEVTEKDGCYYQVGTGEELSSQIDKMSKSKLNGVTPDEILEDFGADSLRLYEVFMGPFDREKVWNSDAVNGCRRFLNRVYDIVMSEKLSEEELEEALKLGHRLVYGVEKDIEAMQFNTAIAKMMEFINAFIGLPSYPKSVVQMLIQVLYPFAPHLCEEAWEHLGFKESLTFTSFPSVNPAYLIDEMILYVVQVNGKVRGKWMLPKDKSQEDLLSFIQTQPHILKYITGPISKVVYVPNKLISIVCDV
jgi:leucyl-tRNA synthetase